MTNYSILRNRLHIFFIYSLLFQKKVVYLQWKSGTKKCIQHLLFLYLCKDNYG